MAIKVNGELIPNEAIEFELSRLVRFYAEHMDEAQVRAQLDALKEQAKEQAIGAKLLILESTKMDIKVPQEEIDDKLNQMKEQSGGEEMFTSLMKQQGLTEDLVKANISEGCRVDMLIGKITEGVPEPTDDEIKAHFEAHAAEYKTPERAQAQHILIKPEEDSDDSKEAAWKKLEEIRDSIMDGESFSDLATEHSACPSGKSAGGSLGWFTRGMMVPEFDSAVFSMEIGDLSDIIETQFGYHVIKKIGHEEEKESSLDDVYENVREFLRHTKRGEVIGTYVRELREKAVVEDDEGVTLK